MNDGHVSLFKNASLMFGNSVCTFAIISNWCVNAGIWVIHILTLLSTMKKIDSDHDNGPLRNASGGHLTHGPFNLGTFNSGHLTHEHKRGHFTHGNLTQRHLTQGVLSDS